MNTGSRHGAAIVYATMLLAACSVLAGQAAAQNAAGVRTGSPPHMSRPSSPAFYHRVQQPWTKGRRAVVAPTTAVRQASYTTPVATRVAGGFIPKHERMAGGSVFVDQRAMAPMTSDGATSILPEPMGESYVESAGPMDGTMVADSCAGGGCCSRDCCLDGCCGGASCGYDCCAGDLCGGNSCADCCLLPCRRIPWDNLSLFAGAHGFKNPSNLGRDASFGFQTGFNWGAPLFIFPYSGVGVQAGLQGVFSNFSGANFTDDSRNQLFFTAGLFRRTDWGFQGGVVYDYMSDDWYGDISLNQIRGELSWVYPCRHEWGFWFAASSDNDVTVSPLDQQANTWDATDLYAFFYRRRFDQALGGEGRLFAGWTEASDGLLGMDMDVPLTGALSLETSFTYLIPEQPQGADGSEHEGWNVAMNLVWYPGRNECVRNSGNYYRPLFRVADNGSLLVDRINPVDDAN